MPIPTYTIMVFPSPILLSPTRPVTTFGKSIERIIKRMTSTLHLYEGVGLAANQVGLEVSLAIIEYKPRIKDTNPEIPFHVLINPKIIEYGKESDETIEGCLSCPGIELKIMRATQILIEAQNVAGEIYRKLIVGYQARIYQHEIDHLNGILIIDRAKGQKALIDAYRADPKNFRKK